MNMPSFQTTVANFVNQHDLEIPVPDRLLNLVSEVGELAKEALKATNYGRAPFETNQDWEDELGDVFFSLICIANTTQVDMQVALDAALKKYRTRMEEKAEASSGG